MGEPNELKRLGNLAAEWETRANCATAEVERLTAHLREVEAERLRLAGDVDRLRDELSAAHMRLSGAKALEAQMDTLDATTATLRADLEQAREQLREASMSADLRRVNDVLRARLADAEDVRRDEAEVERMRAEVADYARQLREAQKRTTWEVRDDGSRALVRCLIIHEQVGLAHLTDVGDQRGATYAYEVPGGVRGGGVHTDPNRDPEQALCAAQRIVETLTGVRP